MTVNQQENINPILKRMVEYLEIKDIPPTRADKLMDSGNGRLGKMLRNNTIPKPAFIENFLRTFPDLSNKWLRTGNGPMDYQDVDTPEENADENNYQETKRIGIPMYNVPGSASNIEMYGDPNDVKIVGYLNIPGAIKNSFALPVHGHSMYPTLENGSWCVLRPIEDRQDIEWGEIYYIEYGDYRLFKRLLKSEDDFESVILWSDNQSEQIMGRPKYAAKTIKMERIRRLCLLTDILKKPNY